MALSSDMIEEVTGVPVQEHDSLEEVEVIFSPAVSCVCEDNASGGLARCRRLRVLSLIDCGLERIGSLQPISATLERLCLANQRLSQMVGLGSLPQLRWLYLQQNQIGRIDNLSRCPRLRVLWLFDNNIVRLEGLGELGELEELWLQNNQVSRLSGIEVATTLRELLLAANRISDYRDLPLLARLPRLESVSFYDAHFGSCPVASREGYRESVTRALPRLTSLDASAVTSADRAAARDAHLESVLELNEKIDAAVRDHRRQAADIESRRVQSSNHSRCLDAEMASAFERLGKLVAEGRAAIAAEHARQREARCGAARALDAALTAALAEYASSAARAQAADAERERNEDDMLRALERRARVERVAALGVARLQYARPPRAACQLLGEHSPDFKWLEARVKASSPPRATLSLARAYHLARLDAQSPTPASDIWFYAPPSAQDLEAFLRQESPGPTVLHLSAAAAITHTFESRPPPSVVLARPLNIDLDDPLELLRSADQLVSSSYQRAPQQQDETALDDAALGLDDTVGDLAILVVCRGCKETPRLGTQAPTHLVARASRDAVPCAPPTVFEVPGGATNRWGIEVDHLLLVASKLCAADPRQLEAELETLDRTHNDENKACLDAFEKAIEDAINQHKICADAELAPDKAQSLQEADKDLAAQESVLAKHRASLNFERQAQASILQDMRLHLGSSMPALHLGTSLHQHGTTSAPPELRPEPPAAVIGASDAAPGVS